MKIFIEGSGLKLPGPSAWRSVWILNMIDKRYIKLSLLISLCMGAIFSIFSIVFYFGDWQRAILLFLLGIFIGALAIPEFEKKAIKNPALFQTIIGIIGGIVAAWAFNAKVEYIILSAVAGAFVGFTAPYWLRYVQIP